VSQIVILFVEAGAAEKLDRVLLHHLSDRGYLKKCFAMR
jgi:hypothetical protein